MKTPVALDPRKAGPRRGHLTVVLVATLMATVGTGSNARAQVAARAVVPPAVTAALGTAYGRYNAAQHCWPARTGSGTSAATGCLAVTRADPVRTPAGDRLFILLGGMAKPDCHACGGLIGFAMLDTTGTPRLVAHSRPIVDGGYGNPGDPKQMHLERLGADRWGWIQESGDVAQGVEEGHLVVWLRRGDRIEAAGALDGTHDNMGGECSMVPRPAGLECYSIKVTYAVDARDVAAQSYPIILKASGQRNGQAVRAEAAAVLDPATLAYIQRDKLP